MMNKLALLTTVLLSVGATACTISTSNEDIVDATLAGVVAGQSWNFVAGHTSAFLSEGEDDFFASLYPSTFTPCGFNEPSGPHIIVAIPKTTGDFEMGFGRNMTFVDGSNNLVSLDGRIRVDAVSATNVTGGLVASYDSDNEVNGTFDVTICPDEN
ncbi:MAG: hypothetical protein ACKV2T_00180 [Kofleriaceae bacterium]